MSIQDYFTIEETKDNFVGIKIVNAEPKVFFPRGFDIPMDEREARKDVFKLLAVIQQFSKAEDGVSREKCETDLTRIPLLSYQYIILDFLNNGYYIEKEVKYRSSSRGKINWKKTIQKEQSYFSDGQVVYLKFQTRYNHLNSDNLLSNIHRYCVYECFRKFGWLYLTTSFSPEKPSIRFNKTLFLAALTEALNHTFNDEKRLLFQSMINIICEIDESDSMSNLELGTFYFEKVWERLIDYVFGTTQGKEFFPFVKWFIFDSGKEQKMKPLEPDTIMKKGEIVYILDAKYYQYCNNLDPFYLPGSSDIQKQITYGKNVESKEIAKPDKIYNAFIMPFNGKGIERYRFVSVGTADWIKYDNTNPNYEYVIGILLDTRYLLTNYTKECQSEIDQMANLIEESLQKYKKYLGTSGVKGY